MFTNDISTLLITIEIELQHLIGRSELTASLWDDFELSSQEKKIKHFYHLESWYPLKEQYQNDPNCVLLYSELKSLLIIFQEYEQEMIFNFLLKLLALFSIAVLGLILILMLAQY